MKKTYSLKDTPIRRYRIQLDESSPLKEIIYDAFIIKRENECKHHFILFLTGTSTQLVDVEYFITHLMERGYSTASIDRSIGGPFHIRMDPKTERMEALRDFISRLKDREKIKAVDIIAHSYASFEVIRLLCGNPGYYGKYIGHIFFLNPAGFNDEIKYLQHCLRFTFTFVMKEYIRSIIGMVFIRKGTEERFMKEFYWYKFRAIHSLFLKTIQNPVRTFKEVADIVSFKLSTPVATLIKHYGYNFHFILNTEDELVDASKTLDHIRGLVSGKRTMTFPGNHLDILIHKSQILTLLDYMDNIMVKV